MVVVSDLVVLGSEISLQQASSASLYTRVGMPHVLLLVRCEFFSAFLS